MDNVRDKTRRIRRALRVCLPLALALPALLPSCVSAPPATYPDTPAVVAKRHGLARSLAALLPPEQRDLPAARQEAARLADTAYRAAAGIARVNKPALAGWFNNRLVNFAFVPLKERGLCWHYQHDMYRELRRIPLHFFRIGCCVRDSGKGSEHNCVYITPAGSEWPHAIILDAWRYHGKLKVMGRDDFSRDHWEDDPASCHFLADFYPECHNYPIEHWAKVRSDHSWKVYLPSNTPEGAASRQGRLMRQNMQQGLRDRCGKPTNY